MKLNAEAWPELIFNFGPYAILVLFILWVVPRATKRTSELSKAAPKLVRYSALTTLVVSWAVVLVMVGYVLFQWSPVRVYEGALGVLWQSEKIYPLNDNVYVKVGGANVPNRESWKFVLVDRERSLDEKAMLGFTYYWGEQEREYTDYLIPVGLIIDNGINDFNFTRKEPETVFTWTDGQWALARYSEPVNRLAFDWGWQAHAADEEQLKSIAEQLSSPNRVNKAEGRMDMRKLSEEDLKSLKRLSTDESAQHQIELELERRER
ncbi:MAG: hypothetical protein HUJ29_05560 [Gammaproteobacteria bacterium]|nr:hypothetical protein [Gammaproteobacteria bacterium]